MRYRIVPTVVWSSVVYKIQWKYGWMPIWFNLRNSCGNQVTFQTTGLAKQLINELQEVIE